MMSTDAKYKPLALYHIVGMQPVLEMSGFGFSVKIFPSMKDAVSESGITQQHIENWVDVMSKSLLKAHGYPVSDAFSGIRVDWGEWGAHHITIPGNACGLDIDGGLYSPPEGRVLLPHNVDCVRQSHLLLCVFTGLMDQLVNNEELKMFGKMPEPFSKVKS